MTDRNGSPNSTTANPLSDDYVNAVIQRHGYQSPEAVIARLNQWIGLHGGEDSVTLLMYEAHKALSRLHADAVPNAQPAFWIDLEPISGSQNLLIRQWQNLGALGPGKHTLFLSPAALQANAPVAEEAQPIQITAVAIVRHDDTDCPQLDYTLEGGLYELPDGAELVWASKPLTGDDGQGTVYDAPQASEAVRILFPTHLRKMWSGGEVQAWLDEHQGVIAPKTSAKGSLERYRQWQADQASEAQCSCPSGDGSLRWPCAKHRTNSENDS